MTYTYPLMGGGSEVTVKVLVAIATRVSLWFSKVELLGSVELGSNWRVKPARMLNVKPYSIYPLLARNYASYALNKL